MKSTIDYCLLYKKCENGKLTVYYDANYARSHDTSILATQYVFRIRSWLISWCSEKQLIVSLSIVKAKYIATTIAAQENIWLMQLIKYLHQPKFS